MHSVCSRIQGLFYPLEKNLYALFIVLGLLFLAGCASHGKITQSTTIEPHTIKTIGFRIPETDADAVSGIEAHQFDAVSREISRRFAAAGYPVTAYAWANSSSGRVDELSKKPRQAYSHILEASTGPIEQDNTPSGFSFALGNSDPRSKQFQKAKLVEVTCTLRDLANPEAAVTLVERKAADSISDTAKDQAQLAQQFYVENIGSTCHNLLTKLDFHPQASDNADLQKLTTQPVRMETGFKPEATPVSQQEKSKLEVTDHRLDQPAESDVQDDTVAPTEKHLSSEQTEKRLDSVQAAKGKAVGRNLKNTYNQPPISDEPKQIGSWRDKQTMIFNQGDTVILEFGYERR